ncbi:hypothetical protein SGQ44_12090 [Flavobacterium sp. Fl-77]|uniref:Uncharacterized protein n=1 Tax=Flavobacterium flavipigmentatum TaxID=2893884 RepID=A0AAJ2W1P8_9FLAO|nr:MULTISPECIES: hypothetical protein [unclassified Flavobacterium]MDX6183052.1 hypothetical protein [Flavobacterium sp. Fl-33]MDX6186505.1 hypothetical protein [Flavobacterium sp. Fl-77]UFH37711.1 hypothetical protein LNP22_13310 [Flavobacterium sp. F-70]
MRKVFSITMTMLLLLVSFQQALIIVHFKFDQKNIEQEFCVNKARPELQCHGKCHLKKELEKSDSTDSELTSIGKKIDMTLISDLEFTVSVLKTINSNKVLFYKELELLEPCLEIFVPPPILYFLIAV